MDRVIELAKKVISQEPVCRDETKWIQRQVDRFAAAEGIRGRAETDRAIYERMYAKAPLPKDMVKIRYWRTGQHLPSGRREALMFAGAIGLDAGETEYFLQACMEKAIWYLRSRRIRKTPMGICTENAYR